ncbi:helicase HerA-like domain-containing protein [Pseudofrankia inefficax]|uniref:AAA ATPase n=1 Tax=Pseudofrankia inefficax (strain DSM 45817 / CECT 9037 / DDB 130130 / EuI1c) TaxID=298654 RepID=E3J1E7_PSEI1|nr:helicase HerA-like domain-containing protein [Pseudofrankia inefficax]ADP80468.1 AAA ATPase [Pseudofrankia inefficax]
MSGAGERAAFAALNLRWIRSFDGVWASAPWHVDGLHADAVRALSAAVRDAAAEPADNSPGLVLQGEAGTGKTHLLGWAREQVQTAGGYFFLVGPLGGGTPFWESVVGAIVDGLARPVDGGETQLRLFLRRLADVVGAAPAITAAVTGEAPLEPVHLKDLVVALRGHDRRLGGDCQDTLRALVLFGSDDLADEDVGRGYLQSMAEQFPNQRAERGMRAPAKPAAEIVRELSRLLALTGPTVIAVDQIDTALAPALPAAHAQPVLGGSPADPPGPREGEPEEGWAGQLVHEVADGLAGLRDLTTRTLCLVTCLPATWDLVAGRAVGPVTDRFRVLDPLGRIGAVGLAERLVARRFAPRYQLIGFVPPYPTWPVHPDALRAAVDETPRALLRRVDTHLRAGLAAGSFTELRAPGAATDPTSEPDRSGLASATPPIEPGPNGTGPDGPAARRLMVGLAELDVAWARLRSAVPGLAALTERNEDALVPDLLAAGLDAWLTELGPAGAAFSRDAQPSGRPALHARLRQVLAERTGAEAHWSFRAILTSQPRTALARLNAACAMSGLVGGIGAGAGGGARHPFAGPPGQRTLVVLRTASWDPAASWDRLPAGGRAAARNDTDPVGRAMLLDAVAAFERAGGVTHLLTEQDVRTFAALRELLDGRHPALETWLLARRPASATPLLAAILGPLFGELAPEPAQYPPVIAVPASRSPFVVTAPATAHLRPLAGQPEPAQPALAIVATPTPEPRPTPPAPVAVPGLAPRPAAMTAPAPTVVRGIEPTTVSRPADLGPPAAEVPPAPSEDPTWRPPSRDGALVRPPVPANPTAARAPWGLPPRELVRPGLAAAALLVPVPVPGSANGGPAGPATPTAPTPAPAPAMAPAPTAPARPVPVAGAPSALAGPASEAPVTPPGTVPVPVPVTLPVAAQAASPAPASAAVEPSSPTGPPPQAVRSNGARPPAWPQRVAPVRTAGLVPVTPMAPASARPPVSAEPPASVSEPPPSIPEPAASVSEPPASVPAAAEPPVTVAAEFSLDPVTAVPVAVPAAPAAFSDLTISVGPAVTAEPARPAPRFELPVLVAQPTGRGERADDAAAAEPTTATSGAAESVPIGTAAGPRAPVRLPLAALRRHTVIFGGSGAGKTVLVRRLVEESALRGVSSIVLDLTGDLARLGDAWPSPPAGWVPGDAELAREYAANTDVVVWTPGRPDGRPLDAGTIDPGELLTPAPGRRARVSVVSLAGLPTDEARQVFVRQLQLATTAWARRLPATDRPLAGLVVMDEAHRLVPAGPPTPSTDSTLLLAAESADHGLGLIFAAPAPHALPDRVPRLAATQFFGRLNAPAQIDAARAMARALGGEAPEVGRLGVGEFYAAGAGLPFPCVTTALCLSHHPGWPLPVEEILARAGRGRTATVGPNGQSS